MKEDKSLEYRIKRLERMVRNNRAIKNEAKTASVGSKMFAWNTSADFRSGIYVITDDEQQLETFMYELPRLREDGCSDRRKDKKPYSLHTQDGDKTGYKEANPHEPISGKIVLYAFSDAFKFRVFCQVHAPR